MHFRYIYDYNLFNLLIFLIFLGDYIWFGKWALDFLVVPLPISTCTFLQRSL